MMKRFAFVAALVAVWAFASGYIDANGIEVTLHKPTTFRNVESVDRKAATREIFSGSCGLNLTYVLDTESHILTISGTGRMTDYDRLGAPWYSNRLFIEHVVVEEGVTSIGETAFQYCSNMVNISLPTTLSSINGWSINNCPSLTSISLPPYLSSIGSDAFYGATSLVSIFIPANVTAIEGDPFGGCTSLKAIEVDESNPRFKAYDGVLYDIIDKILVQYPAGKEDDHFSIPENVTTVGRYAFVDCTELKSINIPFGVKSLVQGAFSNCSSLTSVTIPSSVSSINIFAFEACSSLQSVSYLGVTNAANSDVFNNCNSLNTICVPADYGSNLFGQKSVTCKSSSFSSEDLVNIPSQCFTATCDGSDFVVQETLESKIWEEQTNGCVERQCYNESGLTQWGMCNDTRNDNLLCMKDVCVSKDNIDNHKWEIDIEIVEECDYVNMTEIEISMKKLSNVDTNKLTIAAKITGQGCFVEIIVYLDDEQTAKKLGNDIEHINGDNCEYGILCRKTSVHVTSLSPSGISLASEASFHFISMFTLLVSFVLLMAN